MGKYLYGLGRVRDDKGKVTKRLLNPYVNCLHAQVGTARDNMEVYVCEIIQLFNLYPDRERSNPETGRVYSIEGISPALSTMQGGGREPKILIPEYTNDEYTTRRIRKLTPMECYRLMGVDDADIDTIQSSGISNTQQYKQAGNSIVVDVLYHIFRKMFVELGSESRQMEFF